MRTELTTLLTFASLFFVNETLAADPPRFRVLMITTADGWHHASIADAVPAIRGLADKHHFDLVWEENIGRMFQIHPRIQTAQVAVTDRSFSGLERLPENLWITDEFYEFGDEQVEGLNYLISVDEHTYDPVANWPWGGIAATGRGIRE